MIRLLTICLLLATGVTAQTIVLQEDFDGGKGVFSESGGTWVADSTVVQQGAAAVHMAYTPNINTSLTSPSMDLSGYVGALLDFWHIAKVELADKAYIQVSGDGGSSWDTLKVTDYTGQGFLLNNYVFFDGSYADWGFNINSTPDSNWYRQERFNISAYTGTGFTDVKIRFVVQSDNLLTWNGWRLDDLVVSAITTGELDGPDILHTPLTDGGNTNARKVMATITDSTGVDSAMVYYRVDSGAWIGPNTMSSSGSYHEYPIPGQVVGSVVDYYIKAVDATAWQNISFHPQNEPENYHTYTIINAVFTFPYFEDFEGATAADWTHLPDLTTGNTGTTPTDDWELGDPGQSILSTPHSGVNAWVTGLFSNYSNFSRSALFSPVFDLSNAIDPGLSLYHKLDCSVGQDGARIDYSLDFGNTWHVLGSRGDPKGVNWYNNPSIGSASDPLARPGWTGTSQQWVRSEYNLTEFVGAGNFIKFRFAFTSSFGWGEGWMVDDIGIDGITSAPNRRKSAFFAHIYPNPAINNTTLSIESITNEQAFIIVSDAVGRACRTIKARLKSGTNNITIPLDGLAAGIYFIEIQHNKQVTTLKLAIEQ